MGSVTERSPGRWRLTVDGPSDPVTGRRRQYTRTVAAKNRSEAVEFLGAFAGELRRDGRAGTTARTLRQASEESIEHASPNLSPNTACAFSGALERYVYTSMLSSRPLANVKAVDLDAFYRTLLENGGKNGQPLKPGTVRKVHAVLSVVFAQAVRWEWLAKNPAADASPPKFYGGELTPPDVDQIRTLIGAAADADDGPLWSTYLLMAAIPGGGVANCAGSGAPRSTWIEGWLRSFAW